MIIGSHKAFIICLPMMFQYRFEKKMTDYHPKKSSEHSLSVAQATPSFPLSRRAKATTATTTMLLGAVFLLFPSTCHCFLPTTSIPKKQSSPSSVAATTTTTTRLSMAFNHDFRDPDMIELFVGGERYENVPLPDSMLDTTIFVGNLCEFARDEDLSQQFRSVTNLKSLPACVARRPNNQSLEYGFVAFPTVQEKEVRI